MKLVESRNIVENVVSPADKFRYLSNREIGDPRFRGGNKYLP